MQSNHIENISTKLLKNTDGIVEDKCHYFVQRVFIEDTDTGNIVYHANYLKFFERARTSLLNLVNVDQNHLLEKLGLRFVLREFCLKLNKPFFFNEFILIETRLKYAQNACIMLEQTAWKIDDNSKDRKNYVKGEFKIVMIDRKNKVRNIKKFLVNSFFKN